MEIEKELPGARRQRLLRQFSKVARASLGTGLMGTLFTFPAVLSSDLQRHPESIYGTPLSMEGLQDLVGSLLMLASLPGAWMTAAVAVRLGRRKSMMLNGVVAVLGWLGVAVIPYPAGILASRCVSGLALGGLSVVVNAYVAELSDDDVRGMMSMSLNLAILLGQVFTVALGYCVRYYVVAFVNALVPACFVIFLVWLPESPSVLVLKDKDEKAKEVLLELRGSKANIAQEVRSYREFNTSQQGEESGSWRKLLQPSVMKNLAVVSALFILVAFTGFLVVNANAAQMFEAAGSTVDAEVAAIVLMLVQFAGGVAGFFLTDKIGRKNILYIGFTLMVLGYGGISAYCGVTQGEESKLAGNLTEVVTSGGGEGGAGGGWIPLASLVTSLAGVSLGVNVMPFILNQEYFPTAIRSQASSVCFTVWTLATFAILQMYTPMVTSLTQAGLYGFYGAVCVLGLPFTVYFVKETMGEAVG